MHYLNISAFYCVPTQCHNSGSGGSVSPAIGISPMRFWGIRTQHLCPGNSLRGVTWLAPEALGCGKPNPINNNQNWIRLGMVHVKIGDSEIVHCWVYHSLPHQRLWKYQTKHQLQSYGPMGWDPHSPSESHYLRGASQWEDGFFHMHAEFFFTVSHDIQ